MQTTSFYTISGSYEIRNGETVAVLYGMTKSGKKLKVEDYFEPFLVVDGMGPEHIEKLSAFIGITEKMWTSSGQNPQRYIGVKSIIPVSQKLRDGTVKEMHRINVRTPRDVPKIRNWKQSYMTCYTADILYPLRYMYSKGIGGYCRIRGELSGEGIMTRPEYSTQVERFAPEIRIMSFDIENSMKKDGPIFCISTWVHTYQTDEWVEKTFAMNQNEDSDYRVLREFIKYIQEADPDVITGYNIDGYDWPKLAERLKYHNIPLNIGRDGSEAILYEKPGKFGMQRHLKLVGRVNFDCYKQVKRALQPLNEDLNSIAQLLSIRGKDPGIDASQIDKFWEKDRAGVIKYCIQDARIPIEIMLHPQCQFVDRGLALSYTAMLPLEESLYAVASRVIDSILVREYELNGYAIPMHRAEHFKDAYYEDEEDFEDEFEGGYVKEPAAGLWPMVGVLDFKSMYPSQIIQNNICWTTFVGSDDAPDSECNQVTVTRYYREKATKKIVDQKEFTHRFYKNKKGILPGVMKRLLVWRAEMVAKKKAAEAAGNNDLVRFYDTVQYSIKADIMNAMYGVMGSEFYRFSVVEIAESITGFSRDEIVASIEYIEMQGYHVLYSDTDSVFVLTGKNTVEEAFAICEKFATELSHGDLTLEVEDILDPWFNHGKKKYYIGLSVKKGKTKVRGYALRRRDSFEKQREILSFVLDSLMKRRNMDEVFNEVGAMLQELKQDTKQTEKLILSKSVKDSSEYKSPESMIGVKVSAKMKADGYPFIPGQRIRWIVTNGKTPMEADYVVDGKPFPTPDYSYYISRITKTLKHILPIFGWDEKALKTGKKQSTFEQYIEEEGE